MERTTGVLVSQESAADQRLGFAPEEIVTSEPTRSTRLKWVIVVDAATERGQAANAVACVAAATGRAVDGLIAHGGPDAAGREHPGLPWAGCSILAASAAQIASVRERAAAGGGVLVIDMPAAAQTHRVYDHYLAELAVTEPDSLGVSAVSLVGPRNRIDRIVKKLALLA
jgi:hypothetical protein